MRYFTLLFLILSFQAYAVRPSINPGRSIYSFIDIFHKKTKILDDSEVEVYSTSYDASGKLLPKKKNKSTIPRDEFEKLRKQASAVFQSIPSKGTRVGSEEWFFYGTAFHIGESLVLTNNHVLSRDFSNTTKCDGFRLKDNDGHFYSCKKVHYCHREEDLCLIEMDDRSSGFLFNTKKISFSLLPTLKISNFSEPDDSHLPVTAIGNSQGHGIHVSIGRGIKSKRNGYDIYAALRDGNSGGPAIGPDGTVIGIVRTESHEKVGPNVSNNAVKMTKVIELIRDALREDQETLEKFNRAVIE